MINMIGLIFANHPNTFGALAEQRAVVSLPFGGRYRLIDFALSNMVNAGITTVGLITPHRYRSILDHVGAGKAWQLNRKTGGLFVMPGQIAGMKKPESKFLLHDILQNRVYIDRAKEDLVLIMTGTQVFNYNFTEIAREHERQGRDITMFYQNDRRCPLKECRYLSIGDNQRVDAITGEPATSPKLFCDCMIVSRSLLLRFFDWYENSPAIDVCDIIKENITELKVYAEPLGGYMKQIENIADYMQANQDMLSLELRSELFNSRQNIYTKVQDFAPARYRSTALVKNSLIPAGCQIEGHVENSILFRGVKVGAGAVVKNSILLQNCVVERNATLSYAICDKSVQVAEGMQMAGTDLMPYIVT